MISVKLIFDSLPTQSVPILETRSGIYFLYDGKEVVYVGKSNNIIFRVHTHKYGKLHTGIKKCFTRAKSKEYPNYDDFMLSVIENRWIKRLTPKYNLQGNPRYIYNQKKKCYETATPHTKVR